MPSERGSLPPESARVPVDIRRFPWIRKLAADYAFEFSSLAPFYAGDPADTSSWSDAIARVQPHPRLRAEIARVIDAQQARRGAPQPAREAGARLADPKTVAIVTGQQAGLFGGPVYCLYKALTAITLAEQVTREHGVPAIAVFWVEGEDHDWEEVSSCGVLDAEFQRRKVTLPAPPGAGTSPIARVLLGDEVTAAIDELAALLPPTEFTGALIADLRDAYRPGYGMADAFARLMEKFLGGRGLVVFDAADAAAKPIAGSVFAREVQEPGQTWHLAGEAGDRLAALGYHAQVTASTHDAAAMFRLDGTRTAIPLSDLPALAAEVRAQPEGFSPNVLLRPLVQDTLFPTICYVSGPSELAYLGQLKSVYAHFGVPMPLYYPRLTATVLDSAGAKFLAKHGLALEALHARDDSTLNHLLAASLPPAVDQALQEAADAVERSMTALIAAVPAIDATLEGAARSTLGKMQHDLAALRGKVISAAKKRDETLRRQFLRAQSQAFPDGTPQERAIGSVSLLNRYGPALIDQLSAQLADMPLDLGHHWIFTV